MPYSPTTWQDSPSTATPIDAVNLNKMESGIAAAHTTADAAETPTGAQTKADAAQAAAVQRANHTGTQTADTLTDGATNRLYTTAEKNKLSGIESAATANATNAQLRDRATHTGEQPISSVTGLQAALTGKSDSTHNHAGAYIPAGDITVIDQVTQAQYDALTPVATTLYVIVG